MFHGNVSLSYPSRPVLQATAFQKVKGKVKVFLVFSLTEHHAMKAHWTEEV